MRFLILVFLGSVLVPGFLTPAIAGSPIDDFWRDNYEPRCTKLTAAALDCTLCHTSQGSEELNAYGRHMQSVKYDQNISWSAAIQAIEQNDSDEDGVRNIDEINPPPGQDCSLPGDPDDTPVAVENKGWGWLKALFGK